MKVAASHIVLSSGALWEGIDFAVEHISSAKTVAAIHPGHRLAVNLGVPHYGYIKNRGRWRTQLYETGAVGVVPYGEVNEFRADVDIVCVTISLHLALLEKLFDGAPVRLIQCRGITDPAIYQLSLALQKELLDPHFVGKVYAESLVHALALHLVGTYADEKSRIAFPKGRLTAAQLKTVIDYCYDRRETGVSLSHLAEQARLSPFHFARLFKQTVGYSPCRFLQQLKIEEAKRLIRGKRQSLTEIAYQLGFADQAHFCKSFRKVTGVSPRRF